MKFFCRFSMMVAILATAAFAENVQLSKDRYLDKCRGAWAGQMIGVSFGAPHEFRSNGAIIEGPLQEWGPDRLSNSIDQDDCYVEMTFLKALEEHGLDITFEQAGKAFAASQYPLWHANDSGRTNCRQGIMPPLSGHPRFNRHADDIDFQIEADLFGILCPGMPSASNDLCEIFGHIMNYGDGVYGGMFVSGMYAAAYFEDKDVEKVVRAGLACIPESSDYHKCISDVVTWHKENPDDWKITWKKIEDKWQDDVDCAPGNKFNIDAKMNGAYIAVGLLYGAGDFAKTLDVTTRCGQDADCNPSNAVGVLGCMLGYSKIDDVWKGGIDPIRDENFSHTNYSFTTLIPVCQKITELILARAGGKIDGDSYVIPVQAPLPPATLEQWVDQKRILSDVIPKHVVNAWKAEWQVLACGTDMEPGLKTDALGRTNVLMLHPVSQDNAAVLTGPIVVPAGGSPKIQLEVASHPKGNWLLRVYAGDSKLLEESIDTKGQWNIKTIDVKDYAGKSVTLRIENAANDWAYEAGYFHAISIAP
jgi:hypothetical protein